MSELKDLYHLNVLSWETLPFYDGTFRSTKTLKMDFVELPDWFTMQQVDKENKVEATQQILDYVQLSKNTTLIQIIFTKKSDTKEMLELAQSEGSCQEEDCYCEEEEEEEEDEEEEENGCCCEEGEEGCCSKK